MQIYILKVKWEDGMSDHLDWFIHGVFKSKWGAMNKVDQLKKSKYKFHFAIDIKELEE